MRQKIIYLVLAVLAFGGMQAQDTVRYGDSNYYHMPHDSIIVIRTISPDAWFGAHGLNYIEYNISEPLTVYGIAILSSYKPYFVKPNGVTGSLIHVDTNVANVDLYAMLLVKEGGHYFHFDSVRWSPRSPNRYFEFEQSHFTFHERGVDTVVPVYEFYFSLPRVVVDTFYVGIFSTYANFDRQGNRGSHINGYNATDGDAVGKRWPLFLLEVESGGSSYLVEQFFRRGRLQDGVVEIVDTSEYVRDPRMFIGGAFPIIVPPDTDSFECPRVQNLRVAEYRAGRPMFNWDRAGGQQPFQIAFGPADEDPEGYRVVSAASPPYLLPDLELDSTVVYAARCRGRCYHTCVIHDTILWSEWSDTIHFTIGRDTPEGVVPVGRGEVAFALSPNPAKERVTVAIGEDVGMPCTVVLRDEQGRELLRQRMEGRELTLSTRGLATGVCLVTVESPRGSSTQKLVVEN